MPTATYVSLNQITLAANVASITIPVPTGYRDVILVSNYTGTSDSQTSNMRINDDSGSNYTMVGVRGNGSTTASYTSSGTHGYFAYAGGTNSVVETSIVQIMDCNAIDKHKTWLVRSDNAGTKSEAMANRWASTAAVTSITLYMSSGSLSAGSTFNLFGIEA